MTTDPIPESTQAVATDWQKLYVNYQAASAAIVDATGDIADELLERHEQAARALIAFPATALTHVGQKIRAVQNLVHIDQLYPGLTNILLSDIFRLLGIDQPDEPPLPPSLQK
jgi:hypothetical protein